MTMLVIEPGVRLWGSERALLATLDALIAANGPLVMLVPTGAEIVAELEHRAVTVVEADIGFLHRRSRAARLRFMLTLARVCLRHRVGRIYLNQAGLCRLVSPVSRALGLPLINHVRLREDVVRAAGLKASPRAPVTSIFVSEDLRALFPRGDGARPNVDLHTAYDPYELDPSLAHLALRERPSDTPTLCVGRLSPGKGQEKLIAAVALARRHGVDISVGLFGSDVSNGRYEAHLRSQAGSLGVADLIAFHGYSTTVSAHMANARFVAVPSSYESLGRVILEAWDAGALPICPAESGGAAEIVGLASGGLVYGENTPDGLCAALMHAHALSEADRLRMVRQGREWISARLSVDAYVETLRGTLFPSRATGAVAI